MPSTTPDLANDILSLNRTTERMILSSFQFTTRKNKKTVKALKPIVTHPEHYPDPIIYQASW